jgi:two-component system response regulator YesN
MYQVIIADDEVIERTVLGRKLEKAFGDGICLRQARNGREVLALYHEKPADILILDIEMPGVTGLEAAEQIRAEGAGCGIIFLTAFDEFAYAKRAISVRALDYLLKPCDDRELIAAVEEGMRLADGRRRRAAQMEGAGRSGRETVPAGRQARNVSAGQAQDPAARDPARSSGGAPVPGWTDPARPGSGAEIGGDGMRAAESEGAAGTGGQQEKIRRIIRREYRNELTVSGIADELGYSEAYFCKLFKQYFGQSFVSYLTDYRIREARRLLAETNLSVKEAGQAVGYADANYFAKVFKRVTGQSPTEYRVDNMH